MCHAKKLGHHLFIQQTFIEHFLCALTTVGMDDLYPLLPLWSYMLMVRGIDNEGNK